MGRECLSLSLPDLEPVATPEQIAGYVAVAHELIRRGESPGTLTEIRALVARATGAAGDPGASNTRVIAPPTHESAEGGRE